MPASSLTNAPRADRTLLRPPGWVGHLFAGAEGRSERPHSDGSPLRIAEADRWTLLSTRIPRADALGPRDFQQATAGAYRTLGEALAARRDFRPVRVWNLIPHIHRPCDGGLDRYMVFNAGRHDAYRRWFGEGFGGGGGGGALPTATGVGHRGEELVIHLLATDLPRRAIENPRQVAAHRYSERYGPKPPCFARATAVGEGEGRPPRVLVGGTASILGEESVHAGDLGLQARETFRNLASLLRAAWEDEGGPEHSPDQDWQSRFTELRVYHPRRADRPALEALVRPHFPSVRRIEWFRADLCRRDLLVEIEGVAEIRDQGPDTMLGSDR